MPRPAFRSLRKGAPAGPSGPGRLRRFGVGQADCGLGIFCIFVVFRTSKVSRYMAQSRRRSVRRIRKTRRRVMTRAGIQQSAAAGATIMQMLDHAHSTQCQQLSRAARMGGNSSAALCRIFPNKSIFTTAGMDPDKPAAAAFRECRGPGPGARTGSTQYAERNSQNAERNSREPTFEG